MTLSYEQEFPSKGDNDSEMNGAECLLRTLLANKINVCFMNPGTSEMQFVSALDRAGGMRGILCLYEGVCSGAADGYARMTRRPASTLLHLGPGLANALSNFHNARKARSPIVNIVGEHSTQHLPHNAPLSADTEAFARPVSGWVKTLDSAGAMGAQAAEAVAAAVQPPGQVASFIIPADFSWSAAGAPGPAIAHPAPATPAPERIRAARALLGPGTAFLLGGSSLLGDAPALAASTGLPVFADRNAARYERGAGRFAPLRIPYFPEQAEAALAGVRRLILVEAQNPVSFFGYPGRRSHVAPADCEMFELASFAEDGRAALQELAGSTEVMVSLPSTNLPHGAALTPETVGMAVAALLPEGAIVSDEMVSSGEPVWTQLGSSAPHCFLPVTGGSIGQGLPVALGAAVACPDRKVVALEADGSAMYSLQALWTMARESLDVVTVIFANRRYRILDVEMKRTGAAAIGPLANDMIDIGRPALDWVKLAEAQGVSASRAASADEFIDQFRGAVKERGPRLIEAVLEP
jgi:acetolactate synthase I/II/III large subunit